MSYPTKSVREACWNARDKFWQCLDLNNEEEKACLKWKEEYLNNCSQTWVKHFNRKRKYEKYKAGMDEAGWMQLTEEETSKSK